MKSPVLNIMVLCGTCKHSEMGNLSCAKHHKLHYPLMVNEHDCKDFEYDSSGEIIQKTIFNQANLPECNECAHELNGVCDGKKWIPFKTNPRCEFYREKRLTCKHAIPFHQYGNGIRNNYCSLPCEQRKTDAREYEKACCPDAHRTDYMECYEIKIKNHEYRRRSNRIT